MTDRAAIEQQIEALLAAAGLDSVTLSNRLYAQGAGLFSKLGRTPEDRRVVLASDLWRRARKRVRELEEIDLVRFREVVKKVEEHRPPGSYVLKLEPARLD